MGEDNKKRLNILLQLVPPPEPLRNVLEEGEMEQLVVDVEKKSWEFTLLFPHLLPPAPLKEWIKRVKERFASIAEVSFTFLYRNPPSLAEAVSLYWPVLLETLKEEWPSFSLQRYLEHTPKIEGGKLLFPALNGTSLEVLRARRAEERIASFYRAWTGLSPSVQLILSEEAKTLQDLYAEKREEEEKQAVEALLLAANSPEERVEEKETKPELLFYGGKIEGEARPLREIREEEKWVIVQGTLFAIDSRELKSGSTLFLLKVTDFTDSILVKLFARSQEDKTLLSQLKEGMWVKIRGSVQEDTFERDLILIAHDINQILPYERKDEAPMKRVELHLHTTMSAMDSNLSPKRAIAQAAKWGHPAIAVTDHGGVQSFPEAFDAAQKHGVKLIFGMEAYMVDDGVPIVHRPAHRSLQDDTYVVFDVETTGLSAAYDTIIELSAVKMREGEVIDRFERFANPHRPLSAKIKELTHITDEMLAGAPEVGEVLREFRDFMGDAVLVAHNARFDMGFISVGFRREGMGEIGNPVLDTLELARNLLKDLKNHRLDTLSSYYGVTLTQHHRAVYDAEATGHLLFKMLDTLKEKGVEYLDQVNGLRAVEDFKRQRPFHATLLVKNEVGLKNLYKLISLSYLEYFHRNPRIPKGELERHREGLIVGSACEDGEIFEIAMQKSEEELKEAVRFYDYIEVQPLSHYKYLIEEELIRDEEHLKEILRKLIRVAKEEGKPVVATGNVHHLEPHELIYRKILIKAQNGIKTKDPKHLVPQYFRTTEEMLAEFSFLGKELAEEIVIASPRRLADEVEEMKPFPDELFTPVIEGAEEEMERMSFETARRIYGDPLPEIVESRLKKELNSIIHNGFAVIYLIAHKLVTKSLDDGYLVGSRGSVGSSLVATMSRITEVNPLPPHYVCPNCKFSQFITDGSVGSGFDLPEKDCPKCGAPLKRDGHDIPFETFMGFKGDKVPDIDLNFSGDYQPRAHKYTEELFGKEYVYRAGTISTVAEKTAYGFVRKYLEETGTNVRKAEMDRLALGCTGVKRTTGQHPGGLMVIPQYKEVYDFTPIQHPADDADSETITTHFDYHAISGRLLKLDILGHDDPTVLRMLQDLSGIDPKEIPLSDPAVMKLFSGTESLGKNLELEAIGCYTGTLGIPEFGTRFVRQMLEETKPSTFAELVQISGLSHGTDVWLNNAQELIRNGIAELKDVIGCRDDIMTYLIYKGLEPSRAFKIMEGVRKGKGITPEDQEYMRSFQVPEWYITSCLRIKYMFPKAHAVAYVLMALRIAYFKVHHPILYYATYFSVRASDFDLSIVQKGADHVKEKIREINEKGADAPAKEKNLLTVLEVAYEMLKRGFHFKNIDLYRSDATRFLIEGDGLIPPFSALPGVGESASLNIVKAREEGPFLSKEDLQSRARLSKTVMELLEGYGCLDDLPDSNQLSLFNF
ncbi:DNA polymerase III (alpha subunit) [[Clostridium] ultunense Esp]|nr:DNA polymerase III (alpha subunit) [[Clostridium] ultunense Esp]